MGTSKKHVRSIFPNFDPPPHLFAPVRFTCTNPSAHPTTLPLQPTFVLLSYPLPLSQKKFRDSKERKEKNEFFCKLKIKDQ